MSSDDPAGAAGGLFSRLRTLFGASEPVAADEAAAPALEESASDEAIESARREMIERVIAFDEKKVVDVMAPRADIYAVDIETPLDELTRVFAEAGHSRMPIYRGDLDDPVGMVHIKDVVALLSNGAGQTSSSKAQLDAAKETDPVLATIRRDILYAPPSMRVTDLLLKMQVSRIHMALVIDEYGGTDGLVTIEDLVEEIVGDINDEHDEAEDPSISQSSDDGWVVDARVELDVFAEETGVSLRAEDDDIDTVGGYVVSLAGRLPQRGEIIAGEAGFDFEITEADARKVRRIRIRRSARQPAEAAE